MKKLLFMSVASSVFVVFGCSSDSKDKADQSSVSAASEANSIVSVASISADAVDSTIGDAMQALSDGSDSAAGLSLIAPGSTDVTRTASCELSGESAVQTLIRTMTKTMEKDGPRMTMVHTLKGEDSKIRTFSQPGVQLACNGEQKVPEIDWSKDVAGITMSAQIKRAMTHTITTTKLANGDVREFIRTSSAEGTRTHKWLSAVKDAAASTITVEKEVTSSMTLIRNVTNRNGAEETIQMTLATKDGSPLKIQMVRDSENWDLKSRTIQSGTLVAARLGDGRIESAFKDLLITFAEEECSLVSGEVTATIYKEGESVAAKTLVFKVVNGEYSLGDSVIGEVPDFVMTPCEKTDIVD